MGIEGIDHLYAETLSWERSVEFWEGLGFELAEQWGTEGHRAGRLVCGEAGVVLAEIGPGSEPPAFNVFFRVDGFDDGDPSPEVEVINPVEATHWGTRWMRVRDPDGRVYSLEEKPGGH